MSRVSQVFRLMPALLSLPALLLVFSLYLVGAANEHLVQAAQERYSAYLLADEWRRSVDDLTRVARTFVVTGNPEWEQQYAEILDIRNGKRPRPHHYEKIYWDFRAADMELSRGYGDRVPLQDRMVAAGFTSDELDKLAEAQRFGEELVQFERTAMHMAKGQLADGKGGFSVKGEPDRAKARDLMFSKSYHRSKAKVMKSLDELFFLLEDRTQSAVVEAVVQKNWWYAMLVASIATIVLTAVAWGYAPR